MQSRANGLLKEKGVAVSGFAVSAAPVQNTVAGSASTLGNVVRITATSHVAELARAAANAYATAYIDWRKERVQAQISSGIDALKKKLAGYEGPATVSTEYLVMAQRLQDLQLLAATATGNFRVLVPATAPETPVSPKPLRSAILGFGVGLFAAIGLAFLLEQFDTRLRHADEVARILRRPILGRIPRISKKLLGESAVVALTQPDGHPAEAFRLLRTNLEFMRVDEDVKSLLVTSSVQGEGKSVCVANLAVTLAMGGKKVFIVDADLRRPRQHQYFGLGNAVGVSTVVTGQTSLDDALHKVRLEPVTGANEVDFKTWAGGSESLSRIYVLTSGPLPPNPGEIVSSRRFAAVIETLAEEADVVLVDSPAMLAVGDTAALASLVDGLVFLVDMHTAKRPILEQAADQLVRLPCRSLGIVLRVEGAKRGGYYSSYRYYEYADGNGKRRGRRSKGAASARADVSRRAPGCRRAASVYPSPDEMKRAPPRRGGALSIALRWCGRCELGAAAAQERSAADQTGAGAEDQDDLATSESEFTTLSGLFSRSLQTREVVLEDAFDPRVVLAEDRVVVGVLQGGADLRGRPVAVDKAVLGVLDDRIDGRLRDRSLSDHSEHEEEQEGERDGTHQFGLHIFTPPHDICCAGVMSLRRRYYR